VILFDFKHVVIIVWPDLDQVLVASPMNHGVMLSIDEMLEALERVRTNGS
jgi:hypothetical protein